MEESFRNTLIIISAIIIGAIFVHGLWSIRKNKNPYKLKAKPQDFDELSTKSSHEKADPSGFDQDGIGSVKVVKKQSVANENNKDTVASIHADTATSSALDKIEPIIGDDLSPELELAVTEPTNNDEVTNDVGVNAKAKAEVKAKVNTEIEAKPEVISVYRDPVSQPKPQTRKRVSKKPTKAELKRNQMEINFGDTASVESENSEKSNNKKDIQHAELNSIEPEVLAISVIAPQGQIISGAALLPTLLTLGMKYGEMNIFHRHQDNAGNGKVTFSLANALNPGTFDLDNMESFVTQGVSLFMTLPNAGDPFEVFDQMLIAAKQLANGFNAQLLDDKRSVLTKQTEQHYISRIREFERKSRIAAL